MIHISALSPRRVPVLKIRVYPPGLSATFTATSRKSSDTASLFCKWLNTTRREWVVSSFALVMRGSTYMRSAFALGTVVVIRFDSISELAIFASIALRCELVRVK